MNCVYLQLAYDEDHQVPTLHLIICQKNELLPYNCYTLHSLVKMLQGPPDSLSGHHSSLGHLLNPVPHTLTPSHTHRRATGSPSTSSSLVMSWSGSRSSVRLPSSSPSAYILLLMSYYSNAATSSSENQVKM